jgi:hypothetical protein
MVSFSREEETDNVHSRHGTDVTTERPKYVPLRAVIHSAAGGSFLGRVATNYNRLSRIGAAAATVPLKAECQVISLRRRGRR